VTGSNLLNVSWSPAGSLNDANILNPIATPIVTTTYVVTAVQQGGNLINNGDFSQGRTGFTSDYVVGFGGPFGQLSAEGTYEVATSPANVHLNFAACVDHTTGTGNMLVVNGSNIPGENIWCQNLSVAPNTDYAFSAWLAAVEPTNPADLRFEINGTPLGQVLNASGVVCNWQQFFATWNSGASNTAQICITNLNTQTSGNDFALDDLVFSPICTVTDTVVVTVSDPVATATNDGPVCAGGTINLNASGGDAYAWSGPNGFSANGAAQTLSNTTVVQSGTYTVTATDTLGCTATASTLVAINAEPVVDAGPNASICLGNSAVITATANNGQAPYVFSWNQGLGQGQAQTVSPTVTTTYTVTAQDANGCSSTDSVTITVNANPIAAAGSDAAICAGGSASLEASATDGTAPYTFDWDNGLGQGATQTVTPASTTVYTVTATDANGCSSTDQVTITVNDNPVASAGNNAVICPGESTQLNASASGGATPYTFDWDNGLGQGATQTVSPAVTTVYSVTVTDANGCSGSAQVSVDVSPLPSLSVATTEVSCNGACNGSATVTPSGGTPPYTVVFLNAAGDTLQIGANNSINGLCAGNYSVAITDNGGAAGCAASATFAIGEPTALQASIGQTAATCGLSNGSLSVSTNGGTGAPTFAWSPNVGTGATVTNLAPGQYTVTVSDANGCTVTLTETLNGGPALTATASATATTCNAANGSVAVTVNTGTPSYTYAWTPNVGNTDVANNLSAGTYTITVTDAAGCTATVDATVGASNGIALDGTASPVECFGGNDGSINTTVTPAGGTYTYAWTGGATGANPTGLTAGTYFVTVTDANGCADVDTFVVADGISVSVDAGQDQSLLLGTVADLNATSPFAGNYVWNGTNGFFALSEDTTFTAAAVGDYVFTVTLSVGNCSASDEVTITVFAEGQIAMPNAFTPNNDGTNDFYTPLVAGNLTIVEFVIFNRWGEEVFNSVQQNTLLWDGNYKGSEQPRDVYLWFVRYTDAQGIERTINGDMILIR
jgi:gliding motility-associated-like protein